MSHWVGGLTALGAAPMTFLVGVIRAHWPSDRDTVSGAKQARRGGAPSPGIQQTC